MSVKIKVCGIASAAQAREIDALGADYLGVVFAPNSPRRVDLKLAREISAARKRGRLVGVFTEPDIDFIRRAAEEARLDVAQLHFENSDKAALALRGAVETWGVFSLSSIADVDAAAQSPADRVLVDSRSGGQFGGTGVCADFRLARELSRRREIVLAGGMSLENAARAAAEVRPFAIDVNSRFETAPGVNDTALLKKLFELKL